MCNTVHAVHTQMQFRWYLKKKVYILIILESTFFQKKKIICIEIPLVLVDISIGSILPK